VLEFTIVLSCALIFEAFLHLAGVLTLARKMRRDRPAPVAEQRLPKAAVIISLRGADPGIRKCLLALIQQDYPCFHVEIVVDSDRDPTWSIVQEVVRETGCPHVRFSTLNSRGGNRSLKCSSLIQAVSALDQTHQIIAFCDADVVPHRTWLRELVTPLLDPQVGVTSGNRWYAGPRRLFGSQARAVWNSAAVGQMSLFGIPWGGSLAIRRQTFDEAGLLFKWSHSFNDDLVVGEGVRSLGLKLRLVPSVIMVDEGESRLENVRSFVFRQLMHLRFYHPAWRRVAGFGLLTSGLSLAAVLCLMLGIVERHWDAVLWSSGSLATWAALLAVCYRIVESSVTTTLKQHGRNVNPLGLRALSATPLAVGMFAAALVPALVRRTVVWRGVIYRISAPWRVELLSDQLNAAAPIASQANAPVEPARRAA
jgi:cellulose synthase/poly-beta-1,6-N-acetylglucosamine synthase-like glycosyltransferase